MTDVIDLWVAFRAQGVRWPLRATDQVEIWRGQVFLGVVSGDTIRHAIQHHVAAAALTAHVGRELRGDVVLPVAVPTILPRKALAPPFTREQREAFREKRRKKSGGSDPQR